MKHLKMLTLVVVVFGSLIASIGAGTASATVLCSTATEPCTLEHQYAFGTKINATNEGTVTLTTSFLNIECLKSSVAGKTTFSGPAETIPAAVESLTFESCNCEVKVLKAGSLQITNITFTYNGTLKSSGAEITSSCSTIFGNVHCIYATNGTDLGTLTAGNPAKMDISSASIPRLTTNALCDETANWDANYKITSPTPLYVGIA